MLQLISNQFSQKYWSNVTIVLRQDRTPESEVFSDCAASQISMRNEWVCMFSISWTVGDRPTRWGFWHEWTKKQTNERMNAITNRSKNHASTAFVGILRKIYLIATMFFLTTNSRTIANYLINRYPTGSSLYPFDAEKRATVDRLLDWDLGHVYKAMSELCVRIYFIFCWSSWSPVSIYAEFHVVEMSWMLSWANQ